MSSSFSPHPPLRSLGPYLFRLLVYLVNGLTLSAIPPRPPTPAQKPNAGHGRLILEVCRSQWYTTVGRTPPNEGSACRKYLYLTTHNVHERQTSMPIAGFEPNPSKREAADLRLRPLGHWDLLICLQSFSLYLDESLVASPHFRFVDKFACISSKHKLI